MAILAHGSLMSTAEARRIPKIIAELKVSRELGRPVSDRTVREQS